MAGSALDGMYLNYHWPLTLVNLLNGLIVNQQSSPNTPQIASLPVLRVWFSQPRASNDRHVEVLTTNFKLPLSIGEFSIEILRTSCTLQVWYMDRSNNWIQMRDENYQPMQITLSSSQEVSWYKYHAYTYPIVAKAIQFRISRNTDLTLGNQPFNVGLRNGLIRRNIYARTQGTQQLATELDSMGNVIAKYIRDWDASDAIDDNAFTFWRSAPQPDSQAVVSLYLDVRNPDGSPQLIDTLYLDPVYTNQNLNVYYSTDDTVGTRNLSPISLPPDIDENTQWTAGSGLFDISESGGVSLYQTPMAVGPQISQPAWIGVEWAMAFDPVSGPPQDPVLFGVSPGMNALQTISIVGTSDGGSFTLSADGVDFTDALDDTVDGDTMQGALSGLTAIGNGNIMVSGEPGGPWTVNFQNDLGQQAVPNLTVVSSLTGAPTPTIKVETTVAGFSPPNAGGAQFWPKLYYDVGAVQLTLEFDNGNPAETQTYSVPLTPLPEGGVPLRIVGGWTYDPTPQVFLSVILPNGKSLANLTQVAPDLPTQITLDGEVGYQFFRGNMTATVVKLAEYADGYQAFQANPAMYVNPDPVQPDPNSGLIPSTSLDDAIFAVDWTLQDIPLGGGHASFFTNKVWTPVFVNYVTQKGKYYFPRPVMVKYLKLEFYNLTEESYPVYDAGVSVMYQVFPISVTQTATTPTLGSAGAGLLALGGQILTGGLGAVNWLNPSTITSAINSIFGQTVSPISVQVGPGYTTSTVPALPNTSGSTAAATTPEVSSPWVYRRQLVNTVVLAGQQLNNFLYNTGSQVLNPLINWVGATISGAFNSLINFSPSSTALPMQGADFWVVPGQTLAYASNVINGLFQATQVALNPKPTTGYRMRFSTTSVHQYQTKTVVRDAAIAYFAGIREVSAFVTNYIASQDPPSFVFSPYDPNQWSYSQDPPIVQAISGPISTGGMIYQIQNSLFDTTLDNWEQITGSWSIDPAAGKYQFGAATVTADGTQKELLSDLVTAWPALGAGANFSLSVEVQWDGADTTDATEPVTLVVNFYQDGIFVSDQLVSMAATGTSLWTDSDGEQLAGEFAVPEGVNQLRVGLVLTDDALEGQFSFDTVLIQSIDPVEGTTFIDLITSSTFVRVNCQFTDSGVVRSDNMWADADPTNTNISATQLAYYTETIPSNTPSGTWGDNVSTWADPTTTWGEPHAQVAITLDPNMTYQGKRVLHIARAAGVGEAGVAIRQVTNFVPGALFRLCCTFNKPLADGNRVILRLRRVSDGVYIYEYAFDPDKVAGFWYQLQTDLQEVPEGPDQIYTLEAVVSGDAAGDWYINDAWVEIALIRYFVRLGGASEFLHDVTALRYSDKTAIVSATRPVNEITVQTAILSPNAFAYSAQITPNYLK